MTSKDSIDVTLAIAILVAAVAFMTIASGGRFRFTIPDRVVVEVEGRPDVTELQHNYVEHGERTTKNAPAELGH